MPSPIVVPAIGLAIVAAWFAVRYLLWQRRAHRHRNLWVAWVSRRKRIVRKSLPSALGAYVGVFKRAELDSSLAQFVESARVRTALIEKRGRPSAAWIELRRWAKKFAAQLGAENTELIETRYANWIRRLVDESVARYEYALPTAKNRYLTTSQARDLEAWLAYTCAELAKAEAKVRASIRPDLCIEIIRRLLASHAGRVESENRAFCSKQLAEHKVLFDSIEKFPLSDEQRNAIVKDEQFALVVAGAGTGKTSTILGKVAWLISSRQAAASEILVLAFNKRAAEEVGQRLEDAGYHGMEVRTFHSLGLKIHREAAPTAFHLTRLAGDDAALGVFIQEALDQIAQGPQSYLLDRFIGLYRTPLFDETDPVNRERYMATRLMTLKGERVRSEQERRIADWCTMHGIEYEYEKPYTWPGKEGRQFHYRPDFYFPQIDVWLEHWGISRSGRTRPGISESAYTNQMRGKIDAHRMNRTRLLSTHSFDFFEGNWEELLSSKLTELGIEPMLVENGEWIEPEERISRISELAKLMGRFLALFRPSFPLGVRAENALQIPEMDSARSQLFLQLFDAVLMQYEAELEREDAIDFAEMIHSAYQRVESGDWVSQYKYVVVDEFQDISRDRGRLVNALMNVDQDVRFLGVGDDWQSINRFAGADVTLMTEFEEHFGDYERSDLTQTYRYPEQLLRASEKFVTKNPLQLKKSLFASFRSSKKCVYVVPDDRARVIQTIYELDPSDDPVDVLWLTRYHRTKPESESTANRHPKIRSYREETVHSSKGEEADFVVVGDLASEGLGFPSTIEDDPLLTLLQPGTEGFPFGEERRLMYVAMTRAKKGLILLHPVGASPSPFLAELMSKEYEDFVQVGADLMASAHARCPVCEVGLIQEKSSAETGTFWACSNFPQCNHKPVACPICRDAYLALDDDATGLVCVDSRCEGRMPVCPDCGVGGLIPRGKGDFLGCTRFPDCNFTRNLGARRNSPR